MRWRVICIGRNEFEGREFECGGFGCNVSFERVGEGLGDGVESREYCECVLF